MLTIQSFNNDTLGCALKCYVKNDQIWFKGIDVASILEYSNTRKAIRDHIDTDDKLDFGNFSKEERFVPLSPNSEHPQTIMINESGLYALIFGSKMEKAKHFKKWVTSEVLPSLRKTGKYECRPQNITKQLTFSINNERDLHYRVVNFIREYYPNALFTANLGELQDTASKRIASKCSGYLAGSPDLEVKECSDKFIGLCIEFKSPTGQGVLKDNQSNVHELLRKRKYKVVVSNDYDYLLVQIKEYLDNRRYLCEFCHKRPYLCKTMESRDIHYRCFHRHY